MAGPFSFKVEGSRRVVLALRRFPTLAEREIGDAIEDHVIDFVSLMQKSIGGRGDARLRNRTGALRRSFGWRRTSRPGRVRVDAFTAGLPYAKIHEFGGRIKPKKAKDLWVPAPANKTGAGVVRYPSIRAFLQRVEADPNQSGGIAKTKAGRKAYFWIKDLQGFRDGTVKREVLWTLHKSVLIKKRLGMRKRWVSIRQKLRASVSQAAGRAIRRGRSL